MLSLVITQKSGAQQQLDFQQVEVTVGRSDDNDVCLPRSNVSKHHCRLLRRDGRTVLFDLKSTNGTYVNGRRIAAPLVVRRGDKIYVGDFILSVRDASSEVGFDAEQPVQRHSLSLEQDHDDDASAERERAVPHTVPAPSPAASGAPSAMPELAAPPAPGEGLRALADAASEPPSPWTSPPPAVPAASAANTAPSETPSSSGERIAPRVSPPPPPPPRASQPPPPPPAVRASHASQPPPPPAPSAAASPSASQPPRALSAPPPPPPPHARPALPPQPPSTAPARQPGPSAPAPQRTSLPPRFEQLDSSPGAVTSPAVLAPSVRLQGALGTLMERLAQHMDLEQPTESAFPSEQLAVLEGLLDALEAERVIGQGPDRRFLSEAALSEAVGLGPLDRLLTSRAVREVVVDGPSRIVADLGGGLGPVSSFFSSPEAVLRVARRLLARAGKAYDPAHAVHEAVLSDGTRVQVLQPPLSAQGVLLSVRCPPRAPVTAESLVTEGMLSSEMLTVLRGASKARRNVLVVGASGAGVSRVLGALAGLSPEHERVVLLEDAPGLKVDHPQLLHIERSGAPGLGLEALLTHVQRLRPDRLVVDDVRGADALALLSHAAMQRGVLLGMHAGSAQAALEQLELFAQHALGSRGGSLAPLLAQAVHLLLDVGAGDDGVRRLRAIAEIVQADGDRLELRPLFRHDGRFRATEHRASFLVR